MPFSCVSMGTVSMKNYLHMVFDKHVFLLQFAAVQNLNKTLNLFKHSYIIHKMKHKILMYRV